VVVITCIDILLPAQCAALHSSRSAFRQGGDGI
jgi:hypothetical protein